MQVVHNIHLPDDDTHFVKQIGKNPIVGGAGTYQYPKIVATLGFVTGWGHAVDVGGHVGLWSRILAGRFAKVTAFEPVPEFADCYEKNVTSDNVRLHRLAVGDYVGKARLSRREPHIASTVLDPAGDIAADIITLDSIELGSIDFLKIDVDGCEFEVLSGAELTILAEKPVIAIEQKRHAQGAPAIKLLESWGARVAWEKGGDYCMLWK